jgi:DNA-binding response OmpR family regulator/anti-sigma regulatory factor (Ser/Thr protein kinase)
MESGGMHILVVDDSPAILERVRLVLMARGHRVGVADGAMAGLSYLKDHHPEVILLDVEMPNMNGFEFCALIRKSEAWGTVPVIFLSGRGDEVSVVNGFAMGGNDYIAKPFNDQELIVRVETHGAKARLGQELEAKNRALADLAARQETIIAERTAELGASHRQLTETLSRLASERNIQDELVDSRRLASLGKLVADVAHQINTPLGNCIMLMSFLAERLAVLGPGAAESAAIPHEARAFISQVASGIPLIQGNLARINDLVGRFKSITAEESGDQHVAFGFGPIFELLTARFKAAWAARGLTLAFDDRIPADAGLVGYPGLLDLVIENLVVNAFEHAFAGRSAGAATVSASLDGGQVTLECRDDGRGMAPAEFNRIWEPFFSTRQGSLGLGLFVIRNLALGRLRGRVSAESEPGKGCAVRVCFPARLD